MNRAEVRAVMRRTLTAKRGAEMAEAELNAIINQSILAVSRKLGGERKTTTLDMSTNADGTVSLPSDILMIRDVRNNGARMFKISKDEILTTNLTD